MIGLEEIDEPALKSADLTDLNVIDGYSRRPFTTDPFGSSVTFRLPPLPPGWPPVCLDGSDASSTN